MKVGLCGFTIGAEAYFETFGVVEVQVRDLRAREHLGRDAARYHAFHGLAAEHPAETILVVTHGGAIRAIRRHAAGDPGESIENCGTSSLELVDGVLTVT